MNVRPTVWLQAYCAAISGSAIKAAQSAVNLDEVDKHARGIAEGAVEEFEDRWPEAATADDEGDAPQASLETMQQERVSLLAELNKVERERDELKLMVTRLGG